jgi:hypothetical protein
MASRCRHCRGYAFYTFVHSGEHKYADELGFGPEIAEVWKLWRENAGQFKKGNNRPESPEV